MTYLSAVGQEAAETIVTDPSIGQMEYLRDLQNLPEGVLPTFIVVDIEIGDPDIDAVERTITFFVRRHESIRTIFPLMDGKVKQLVLPANDKRFEIEYVDISDAGQQGVTIKEEHFRRCAVMFSDIQTGPLIKFLLFREATKSIFCVVIHHIICDGWSQHIIRNELTAFYRSYLERKEPDLGPLKTQLRDYCSQQNARLHETRETSRDFWGPRLEGYYQLFDIKAFNEKFLARTGKRSFREMPAGEPLTKEELCGIYNNSQAQLYTSIIPKERFDKIKKLAETSRSTVSSLVYSGYYFLLYYYLGKDKILLAALMADRFDAEYQGLIGCLLGGVYFPRDVREDQPIVPFIVETLRDISENCEKIIPSHEFIDLDSTKCRASVDVYINYIKANTGLRTGKAPTGEHTEIGGIHYPICCVIYEYKDGFRFKWKYNPRLFSNEMMEDLVKCYEEILDLISMDSSMTVGKLRGLLEAEEHGL